MALRVPLPAPILEVFLRRYPHMARLVVQRFCRANSLHSGSTRLFVAEERPLAFVSLLRLFVLQSFCTEFFVVQLALRLDKGCRCS